MLHFIHKTTTTSVKDKAMRRRRTTKQFVDLARSVHGDKYDYSQTEYITTADKVAIICPTHGLFYQKATHHLTGHGCKHCGDKKRPSRATTSQFTARANRTHNGKYDYSQVNYINNHTPVNIICPTHGLFVQQPNNHLQGKGCPQCGKLQIGDCLRSDTATFINKAKHIHGNKYDYSQVSYIDNRTPVTIICPKHGQFNQNPMNHLSGRGCPQCGRAITDNKRTKTNNHFITKAIAIHGDKYDYSLVKYTTMRHPVTLICPKHGQFSQTATNHLGGKGCPQCNDSTGEQKIALFLEAHAITYQRQKRFDQCRATKPLPFDFYLPEHKTLIEYHGQQHYRPVTQFGGNKAWEKVLLHDTIKRAFAQKQAIHLIVVPYTVKDIDSYLSAQLATPTTR